MINVWVPLSVKFVRQKGVILNMGFLGRQFCYFFQTSNYFWCVPFKCNVFHSKYILLMYSIIQNLLTYVFDSLFFRATSKSSPLVSFHRIETQCCHNFHQNSAISNPICKVYRTVFVYMCDSQQPFYNQMFTFQRSPSTA